MMEEMARVVNDSTSQMPSDWFVIIVRSVTTITDFGTVEIGHSDKTHHSRRSCS